MPSAAPQRSYWGESHALFCLCPPPATHTHTFCAGCIKGIVFDASTVTFWLFSSCSLRHSLLHGRVRPQRASAGEKRTCWGSANAGDCAEEPQLNRKDPALHSWHAQVLHSLRGEKAFVSFLSFFLFFFDWGLVCSRQSCGNSGLSLMGFCVIKPCRRHRASLTGCFMTSCLKCVHLLIN